MSQIYSRTSGILISLGISTLLLFSGCQKNFTDPDNPAGTGYSSEKIKGPVKIDDLMVITRSAETPAGFESQLLAYGTIVRSIPEIGVVVLRPAAPGIESKISGLPEVEAVVPDLVAKWIDPVKFFPETNPPSIGSDEPYFVFQWGLDAINAPEAWNAGYKGNGARVFILDNGIDAEHTDLASNINTALSTSFVPGEGFNVEDGFYFNHGTHVAGIIAATNNSRGVIGVAPEAEIIAVKVLSESSGSGAFSWINAGIVYAANNGADVINLSLGATFNKNGFFVDEDNVLQKIPAVYIQQIILAQQRAVDYAYRKGALIVTSAGNEYSDFDGNASLMKIPAELNNVITVSATAPDYWYPVRSQNPFLDIPSSYTNYGISLVDLAAPGGDDDFYNKPNWHFDMVLSTIPGGYSWAAGTSMATPHVTGVAALIIGKNGTLTPDEVGKQLFKTADQIGTSGSSDYFGKGRVNAFRAVNE